MASTPWPALRTVTAAGWLIRLSGGRSRRVNSASALAPEGDFETVRALAEHVFARAGQPAIFRISPLTPPGVEDRLEALGYRAHGTVIVMTAPVGRPRTAREVVVDEGRSRSWQDGFDRLSDVAGRDRAIRAAALRRVALPVAFATVHDGAAPVGYGRAVAERGAVGLFDLLVAGDQRRRGHGRQLVAALLAWGRVQGAGVAYLQVRADNAAARACYAALGFRDTYSYHYRERPAASLSSAASGS